jgi:hypothetical protein
VVFLGQQNFHVDNEPKLNKAFYIVKPNRKLVFVRAVVNNFCGLISVDIAAGYHHMFKFCVGTEFYNYSLHTVTFGYRLSLNQKIETLLEISYESLLYCN